MKTLKILLSISVFAFLICINSINGQTVQVYTTVTATGTAWCLNRTINGYFTYHLTYHLNKQGFVDRMHSNVHKADIWDAETGEKYIFVDTGNDNLGISWDWWNNPDNPGFDYDIPENSIPIGTKPGDGCNIWATFKLIAKGGEVYTMRSVTHVTINANGETTAEFYKYYEDCNY